MAKYTELFSEYLEHEGGAEEWTAPPSFDSIPDFKEIFIAYFYDREIGFESPALFGLKLNARAAIVVPDYADKINAIQAAYAGLENPLKKRIKSGSVTRDYGARKNTLTEQPFASEAAMASPSEITDINEYADTETYNNVTDTEEGRTPDEQIAYIRAVEGKITTLTQELLEEFDTLFMQIY